MHSTSFADTNQNARSFKVDRIWKFEYLQNRAWLFHEIKKIELCPIPRSYYFLTWNSVIYDIALVCKQPCNVTWECIVIFQVLLNFVSLMNNFIRKLFKLKSWLKRSENYLALLKPKSLFPTLLWCSL